MRNFGIVPTKALQAGSIEDDGHLLQDLGHIPREKLGVLALLELNLDRVSLHAFMHFGEVRIRHRCHRIISVML
jgi:hypothetical protein